MQSKSELCLISRARLAAGHCRSPCSWKQALKLFGLKAPGKYFNSSRGWPVWQITLLAERLSDETLSAPRGGKRTHSKWGHTLCQARSRTVIKDSCHLRTHARGPRTLQSINAFLLLRQVQCFPFLVRLLRLRGLAKLSKMINLMSWERGSNLVLSECTCSGSYTTLPPD